MNTVVAKKIVSSAAVVGKISVNLVGGRVSSAEFVDGVLWMKIV